MSNGGCAGRYSIPFEVVQAPSSSRFLLHAWGRPELEPVTLVSFPCSLPQVSPCSLLEQHGLFSAHHSCPPREFFTWPSSLFASASQGLLSARGLSWECNSSTSSRHMASREPHSQR